jgi:hypothetical protein
MHKVSSQVVVIEAQGSVGPPPKKIPPYALDFQADFLRIVKASIGSSILYALLSHCSCILCDAVLLVACVTLRWTWWFAPWPFFILLIFYDEIRKLLLRVSPGLMEHTNY